jgi:hemin uptake protein HemP
VLPEEGGKAQPAGIAARRLASEALFGAARELVIVHAGKEYRLRITRNGKLILTA